MEFTKLEIEAIEEAVINLRHDIESTCCDQCIEDCCFDGCKLDSFLNILNGILEKLKKES